MAKSACISMSSLHMVNDGQTVDLSPYMTTKLWDSDGTMTGSPGHITISQTGVYLLEAYLTIQPNNPDSVTNGYSKVTVVDSALQNHAQSSNWISSAFSTANLAEVVKLQAGTVIHLTVRDKIGQGSGVVGHFSATMIA